MTASTAISFAQYYGATWLDLLGTNRGRYRSRRRELLPDAETYARFLAEHDLAPRRPVTADDRDRAIAVREALHRLTVRVVGTRDGSAAGPSIDPADHDLLDETLAAAEPPRLAAGSAVRLTAPPTAEAALGLIAAQAITDLTGPRRLQLHPCADETCSGYFLDATGRRRWCSDTRCGSRVRVREHRARARSDG